MSLFYILLFKPHVRWPSGRAISGLSSSLVAVGFVDSLLFVKLNFRRMRSPEHKLLSRRRLIVFEHAVDGVQEFTHDGDDGLELVLPRATRCW